MMSLFGEGTSSFEHKEYISSHCTEEINTSTDQDPQDLSNFRQITIFACS